MKQKIVKLMIAMAESCFYLFINLLFVVDFTIFFFESYWPGIKAIISSCYSFRRIIIRSPLACQTLIGLSKSN